MKYVFEMEDLECANCAAKMERDISVLPGVHKVSVNFLTQKNDTGSGGQPVGAHFKAGTENLQKV